MVMRNAASRVYARKPLVVSGTVVFDTCRTTQPPSRCSCRLRQDMCRSAADVAIPNHDVGLTVEKGREQLGDVLAGVLVVGVGADDEVGPAWCRRCRP